MGSGQVAKRSSVSVQVNESALLNTSQAEQHIVQSTLLY
jgi:hypothetical protein